MNFLCQYTKSTVGKKTIVAITGSILLAFLILHVVGNLQMFAGRGLTPETTKMNEYAALLKKEMALLWAMRIGLLVSAILHVYFTILLTIENKNARPESYVMKKTYSTAASRMMIYGGLFLFFYIIYHLMHFTVGNAHPELFHGHDVYQTVIDSFHVPAISAVYILAMIALFFHLYHGTVALFQTLGMINPVHLQWVKTLGLGLSVFICGGFIAIPLAILMGWIS